MQNDAYTTINTAVTGLSDDLLKIAGVGLGVGVSIYALRKGWSLLRGFVG